MHCGECKCRALRQRLIVPQQDAKLSMDQPHSGDVRELPNKDCTWIDPNTGTLLCSCSITVVAVSAIPVDGFLQSLFKGNTSSKTEFLFSSFGIK